MLKVFSLNDIVNTILIKRHSEQTLNDSILSIPILEFFASFQNRKMDLFCRWEQDPLAYGVDGISIAWDRMFANAFAPLRFAPKVLNI